jgi:tetratricopeptide (TPR) repeat protein
MAVETLTIRFTSERLRDPRAWFIAGSNAADWLSEILAWNVPHASISLRLVPRSLGDRTPLGSLVTVDGKAKPGVSSRCQPYGCLAESLFLPVEARLDPAAEESELRELFASGTSYVWHPVGGLTKFDRRDVLSIGDLLKRLTPTDADWDRADPGTTFSRRLASLEVDRPQTVELILQEARGDIGSRSDALEELPLAPGEGVGASIARAAAVSLGAIGLAIGRLASMVPGLPRAIPANWIERMNQWFATAFSPEWQSARERELRRLMQMLKKDPDLGLQYAPPLASACDPARGFAPPTFRLFKRLVDFRLWSRKTATSPWPVSSNIQQDLTTKYRELANREIRLGRHRRAAYIYANLLGDWSSAAATLKTGGYFREAATLYLERLNRPFDAAVCLEQDGAWNEAIRLYEKIKAHVKIGELYRKLEQHENAERAYRAAVTSHLQTGDRIAAAHLLDTELKQTDEALATLREGWPDSRQASACLAAEFHLLGRLGRHAEAGRRILELRDEPLGTEQVVLLASVLAEAGQRYPDSKVRADAADVTRIVASRRFVQLEHLRLPPDSRLLASVAKLAPEDRLLARDCDRFLRGALIRFAPPPRQTTQKSGRVALIHRTQLLPQLDWLCGTGTSEYLFTAGYRDKKLLVSRRRWSEIYELPRAVWWSAPALSRYPILLAPCPFDRHEMWVQVRGAAPFSPREIAAPNPGEKKLTIRTPAWSDHETIALARAEHGVSWAITGTSSLVARAFAVDGTPLFSHEIPTDNLALLFAHSPPPASLALHARVEGLFLATGNQLMNVGGEKRVKTIDFDEPIVGLSGSPPYTRLRLAVSFPQGGAVFWRDSSTVRRFGDELSLPRTVFTVSGHLVAVDSRRIEIYRVDRHEVKLEAAIDSPGQPVAVMRVKINEFAILDATAHLAVYRITT